MNARNRKTTNKTQRNIHEIIIYFTLGWNVGMFAQSPRSICIEPPSVYAAPTLLTFLLSASACVRITRTSIERNEARAKRRAGEHTVPTHHFIGFTINIVIGMEIVSSANKLMRREENNDQSIKGYSLHMARCLGCLWFSVCGVGR